MTDSTLDDSFVDLANESYCLDKLTAQMMEPSNTEEDDDFVDLTPSIARLRSARCQKCASDIFYLPEMLALSDEKTLTCRICGVECALAPKESTHADSSPPPDASASSASQRSSFRNLHHLLSSSESSAVEALSKHERFSEQWHRPTVDKVFLHSVRRYMELADAATASDGNELATRGALEPPNVFHHQPSSLAYIPAHYVAVDPLTESVLLCIRGSKQAQDWLTDLSCTPRPYRGGHVHGGMYRAARHLYLQHRAMLEELADAFGGYTIRAVGHSLGAGVAALVCLIAADEGEGDYRYESIGFGPPACISHNLAGKTRNFAVTFVNGPDFAPRLCPVRSSFVQKVFNVSLPSFGKGGGDDSPLRVAVTDKKDALVESWQEIVAATSAKTKKLYPDLHATLATRVEGVRAKLSSRKQAADGGDDEDEVVVTTQETVDLSSSIAPLGDGEQLRFVPPGCVHLIEEGDGRPVLLCDVACEDVFKHDETITKRALDAHRKRAYFEQLDALVLHAPRRESENK